MNSVIAGTTTAGLGAYLIDKAEEMDEARKNKERLQKFLDEMEK